ncbi:MAG: HlyD family secretion protein [Pseudonocardiales bacterium]|nr:HlyD family secretion protein [Pseudonocardiales bacterium]
MSSVAEPCPGAAERSVLHVAAPAPGEEAGAALEGRSPIANPSERLPVDPKSPLKGPAPGRPGPMARFARETLKTAATLFILLLAVLAALVIWDAYVTAPWTRDGSIRVQVASVAPQVSGQITEVRVVDNQYVHQGDVLYVIDPFDFQVALDTDKAQLREKAADLQVKRMQAERRQHLSDLATTSEEQQLYVGNATQAQAAFDAAQQQLAQADINLERTQVRSPVNGHVTNLLMRVGDYAHAGTNNISVIDADSYWIDGYFEETKMAHVCIGDRAEAALMGYRDPIVGRVQTVTRGISVSNAAPSTQGLPSVDPIYTWVRLAQRVPVRIRITDVPAGIPLVSGMTATVTLRGAEAEESGGWLRQRFTSLADHLVDIVHGPQPSPSCVPRIGDENGATVTLPTPKPIAPLSPAEINPGLAPDMNKPPRQ